MTDRLKETMDNTQKAVTDADRHHMGEAISLRISANGVCHGVSFTSETGVKIAAHRYTRGHTDLNESKYL